MAIANAVKCNQPEFKWKTAIGAPIKIKDSRRWKGDTGNFNPMSAEISVDYDCSLDLATGRVLAKGVSVVAIKQSGGGGDKTFHFDVEEGGWTEFRDGAPHGRAGHPAFHVQFHGLVNDIPRLPSLIFHPVDVISLAILELHQKRWRQHVVTSSAKSQLRHVPPRQRKRLNDTLDAWKSIVGRADSLATIEMQRRVANPLAL